MTVDLSNLRLIYSLDENEVGTEARDAFEAVERRHEWSESGVLTARQGGEGVASAACGEPVVPV